MKFEEVLDALRNGERLTNASLSEINGFIVRQVPQTVPADIVPKMTSLPASAREHIASYGEGLRFYDQVLLVMWDDMREEYKATSYVPSWYDIFREDWTIA